MKKRIFLFIISVLMIFSCLPTALADDTPQVTETPQPTETPALEPEPTDKTTEQQLESEAYTVNATSGDYEYSVNGANATIMKYIGTAADVVIPDMLDGYPVTAIGSNAFLNCTCLKSVTIPATVLDIFSSAFGSCVNLYATYFKGNAPNGYNDMFSGCAKGFTAYYLAGSSGFTDPWYGYPTAVFDADVTYSVSFDLNGVSAVMPKTQTVYNGVKALRPDDPVNKYSLFTGWYTEKDCINEWNFNTFVNGNRTLFAKWTDKVFYAISYELNSGVVAASNPISYTAEDTFTLVNPTKSGYDFTGWSGTGITGTAANVTISVGSSGNRTYTANWTPHAYSIIYTLNGGSLSTPNPVSFNIESPAITLINPTRRGCIFSGWLGSGITGVTANVTIPAGSTGDRYYTAKWTEIKYKAVYDANGGTGTAAAVEHHFDDSFVVNSGSGFKRNGYKFAGWNTAANGSGTPYAARSIMKMPDADTTLYAQWKPVVYSIHFNSLYNSTASNPANYTIESMAIKLNNPVRFGYIFNGWTGTELTYNTMDVTIPAGSTGNRTYTAHWVAQHHTAYLSGVNISAGILSCAFSETVMRYGIALGEFEDSITLTPFKEYDGAAVTINGKAVPSYTLNLEKGKSAKVNVKVSLDKTSKTYTFTITRAKSTDSTLSSLSASAGAWSQPFDPNVANYTLTMPEDVKSTAIQAAAAAGKAARVSPASKKITLNNGQSKTVRITVKAQSGAKRTYTITVVRAPSTNADLKSLKASAALSPAFNPGAASYTVILPANKAVFNVSVKAAGYKAAVYIDGTKKPSKKVALANGQSAVVIVSVVSQAGNEKQYAITVTRQ